ncbi:retrovirus-related pol polyprotein from transposon TNT 1-94 [Tanacetum coccineum]
MLVIKRFRERKKIFRERKLSENFVLRNGAVFIALGFQNLFYHKKAQQIRPTLYDGSVIAKETNVISIADSEETLMLEEESRSKMLLKQSDPMVLKQKFNIKPINYAELNRLSKDFGKRFVLQLELSDEQAFRLQTLHPNTDQSASSPVKIEAHRELPKMEAVVQQYHVDKQFFEIQKKQFLIENDRLLDQIISQYIVNIVVNSSVNLNTSMNEHFSVDMNDSVKYVDICNKCLELEAELFKQHNMVEKDEYNRLSKSFSKLEQHCISLELAMQINKEIFQKNNTCVNRTEPSFDQLFELDNLKAELQAKDTTIEKLKANIKCLNKTSTTNSVKKDIDEIKTINIELEHRLIQELLGYVRETFLDIHKPSEKLVAVTPINKKKTVRFAEPVISSTTSQKQLGSSQTKTKQTTKNSVSTSTGVSRSSKSSRSKSTDNTKDDRIMQISSNTQKKNKVGSHSRIVNSKSKSVKKAKKKEEWKPTRKVFTKTGYNWRPTGRTFTLVGNVCPLTRITATNKVPLREPIPLKVVAQESVVTKVYTRRPKVPKTNGSNRKPKIAKFVISNKTEPDTSQGSNTSVAPSSSSSSVDLWLSKLSYDCKDYKVRVACVNGKKYILVIVDDYSRFTWVKFLTSKDEALDFIIKFLKMIQVRLNTTVRKSDLSYLHVFGALCNLNNDSENLGKFQAKADICIFIGYAPKKKANRIYNRSTQKIIETTYVDFDELTAMASVQLDSGPGLKSMIPATFSSGLVPNLIP